MIKLLKAKITAREATKALLQKEIPRINELIKNAREKGELIAKININDYSFATQAMLRKAGYEVEYDCISWIHLYRAIEENEKELMKVAKDAGVEIIEVQYPHRTMPIVVVWQTYRNRKLFSDLFRYVFIK